MDAAPQGGHSRQVSTAPERAALDAVPVPVAYVVRDGTLAITNRAMAQALGVPARSVTGLPVEMVLGPQAGAWIRQALTRPSRDPVSTEVALPTRDGPPRWVVLTLESHFPNAQTAGALPGAQDSPGASITLVDRPQDSALESGERPHSEALDELRGMVEAARPGIAVVDDQWSLQRWNGAFAKIAVLARADLERGASLEPLLKNAWRDALGPRDSAEQLPDLRAHPEGRLEFTAQRDNGDRISVELVLQPDGRIVIMMADVTATSRLEEELRRSERMRAVGELSGGIAHDFNNLLSVIVGTLDVLEDQGLFGEQRELVKTAKRSALRGASLTAALLAFGRRGAGHPEPTSANGVVQGIENVLRRTLGGHVQFETDLTPELWTIHADPGLLENALLNLAINARDAMPEGGTLTLSTENVPGEAGSVDGVVLSVRDTGQGMSDEVREQALEAFFTTKPQGRGAGLGLSMVQRFVRAARGRIFITSVEGEGTEVRLVFPRHKSDAVEADDAKEPRAPGGGHVLLLEADLHVRNALRTMLLRLGYRVSDVDDPAVAVKLIETDPSLTALLADANVPGGPTGLDVIRSAESIRPDLSTFLISGSAVRSEAEGIVVLEKPIRLGALSSALARANEEQDG